MLCLQSNAQRVGVVLSGGGASGMAHIGVLRALEDNDIPIDYITGTSMGAIIGGLYASGMSLDEMEAYFTSNDFLSSVNGELDEQYSYYFKQNAPDASMVNLKIDPDTVLLRTIPSYVVTPIQMDMEMLEVTAQAIAVAGYDFDNLLIPFRCVASDIVNKEQVIFRDGELHQALRASSSFPFYFKPVRFEDRILFDGGLYNNFPVDVMYNEFDPDYIIGSNVSQKTPPPLIDDLFSQIENMIVNRGSEELPCEDGLVISPETGVGTLEFKRTADAIVAGYESAILMMDSILAHVADRTTIQEREIDRQLFTDSRPEYLLGEVRLTGVTDKTARYFKRVLRLNTKHAPKTLEEFKPLYYRIFGDDKISYTYPSIQFNPETRLYDLTIAIEKERKLFIDFGGNFSSRPVNTGFVGVRYNLLGRTPKTFYANSYFGKFYNSVLLGTRLDLSGNNPYYISLSGQLSQWDYFRSFATFFQETKPSFILENEQMAEIEIGRPVGNKAALKLDARLAKDVDSYYLTDNFNAADTADQTRFEYHTTGMHYERITLNDKLYATTGTSLRISGRYVDGKERTTPGSTGVFENQIKKAHRFAVFRLDYENYFYNKKKWNVGFQVNGAFSTQDFFVNQRATLLSSPYFQPIPESRTIFQEEFRAHQFGAGGLKLIYSINNALSLRAEGYIFQPYKEILGSDNFQARYSDAFSKRYYIGSGSIVFQSPVGPISASANYYDQNEEPWSFIINFGYLLFNKRPLE